MSRRCIHSAPDLATAERAIAAAREAGIEDDALSLVARSDIEVQQVPDDLKQPDTDMVPAAARGARRSSSPWWRLACTSPSSSRGF